MKSDTKLCSKMNSEYKIVFFSRILIINDDMEPSFNKLPCDFMCVLVCCEVSEVLSGQGLVIACDCWIKYLTYTRIILDFGLSRDARFSVLDTHTINSTL